MNKAFDELSQGDWYKHPRRAGERRQMVKAIAEQRGWTHNSHLSLRQVARGWQEKPGTVSCSGCSASRVICIPISMKTGLPEDVQEGLHDVQLLWTSLSRAGIEFRGFNNTNGVFGMIPLSKLRTATRDALAYVSAQPDVAEAEVFASANGNSLSA